MLAGRWLNKESPLFLGFLPSYTKPATISYHTPCRRLLTDSIQKIALGLQKPSVPKIVGRQNARAGMSAHSQVGSATCGH
jgi:hypothetical protein